jgi:hypothetical protein
VVATTLPGSTPNMSATSLTGSLEPLLKIQTYEFVRTATHEAQQFDLPFLRGSDSVRKKPTTLPGAVSCARMRVSNGDVMTTIRAPDAKRQDLGPPCR